MIKSFVIANAAGIGQAWAGIPGVEVTPGNRLFSTWFSGGEKEPSSKNTIYLSISDNGGKAFGDLIVMAGPGNGFRAFDPTLWLAPTGQLWLIFNRGNKDAAEHGVHARICTNPDAVTPEWNSPDVHPNWRRCDLAKHVG